MLNKLYEKLSIGKVISGLLLVIIMSVAGFFNSAITSMAEDWIEEIVIAQNSGDTQQIKREVKENKESVDELSDRISDQSSKIDSALAVQEKIQEDVGRILQHLIEN